MSHATAVTLLAREGLQHRLAKWTQENGREPDLMFLSKTLLTIFASETGCPAYPEYVKYGQEFEILGIRTIIYPGDAVLFCHTQEMVDSPGHVSRPKEKRIFDPSKPLKERIGAGDEGCCDA